MTTTQKTQSPIAKKIAEIASKNLMPESRVSAMFTNKIYSNYNVEEVPVWCFNELGTLSRNGNRADMEVIIPNEVMRKFTDAVVADDKAKIRELYLQMVDKYGIMTTTFLPPWERGNKSISAGAAPAQWN